MSQFKQLLIGSLLTMILCAIACSVQPLPQKESLSKHSLLGSWEMKEVHWISTDTTYSISNSQPGLFTFSPNRYSIMWTPTRSPRKPFKVLSKPTDEEIKAGFQSVVFNGGTYEIEEARVVTTASIAKVPGFEGGQQFYKYNINENTLELTMYDETYPDGTKPEWSGKWQTKFVLEKAE